ncbi:MAG: tRNA 2-thiouridine synthesizing protein D [Candidatus Endobugula sp.]|jgi:tRNA 2-thiouridine synthesizing protein D
MIFSLAIYSTPSSQSQDSAYRFANALLAQGHTLFRVFFYHDGVYQGSQLSCPPQDEVNLTTRWQTLAESHGVDLVVCIAAGLRRGVIDRKEAQRYEKGHHNLASGFELSGLGQLVEAAVQSDRLITFGG